MGIGIALGGVTKGLESAENARVTQQELGLRQQALGIQEKTLKRQEQNDLLGQVDKQIALNMDFVTRAVEKGFEGGNDRVQIAEAISPLLKNIEGYAAGVGRDPQVYRDQVDSLLMGPTAEDAAAVEGRASASQKLSERDTLTAAGVDPAKAETSAGIRDPLSSFDRLLLGSNADGSGQSGAVPFEPDQAKRVLGKVYTLPNGKQGLWTRDPQGNIGWELLN